MNNKITNENYELLANSVHNNKYKYNNVVYINSKTPVDIECPIHGVFKQRLGDHINGKQNCPKCGRINSAKSNSVPLDTIKSQIDMLQDNIYVPDYTTYTNASSKMRFTCPTHGEFYQIVNRFIGGIRCGKCGHARGGLVNRLGIDEFIALSRAKHGDRYDYCNVNYIDNTTPVEILCKEHGTFLQTPYNHIRGANCHKCNNKANVFRQSHDTERFITKAKAVHGDTYGYSKVAYVNNKVPVTITCKLHGDFESRPDNHISGTGCPMCNASKGEHKIRDFLIANHIEYKREYKLPNSILRYDFYLPKLNILIEYDGVLHFRAIEHFGGVQHLLIQQQRDSKKNELAVLHKIPLIRVPYTMFTRLDKHLLFRLSKHYKYRVGNKFYKRFVDICEGLHLPGSTELKDVRKYLLYKINYNHNRSAMQ